MTRRNPRFIADCTSRARPLEAARRRARTGRGPLGPPLRAALAARMLL